MVHGYQRFIKRHCKPFGKINAHKQRPYKPGGKGDRHRVNIIIPDIRRFQRLVCHGGYGLGMPPGGDFRHNATVNFMLGYLRGHYI